MAKQPELPLDYGPTGGTARYGEVYPSAAQAADMFARQVGKRHDQTTLSNIQATGTHHQLAVSVGKEFDRPKPLSRAMRRSYRALEQSVNTQYEHMTKPVEQGGMGINVQFVNDNPYTHPREMQEDVEKNKTLKIMTTASTGGHGLWTNEQNDRFRAVHDMFGHLATARDFSPHGEEAAFASHAAMLPNRALRALTSETRAQNAYYVNRGEQFPPNVPVNVPSWATRLEGGPSAPKRKKAYQPELPFGS